MTPVAFQTLFSALYEQYARLKEIFREVALLSVQPYHQSKFIELHFSW